MLPLINTLDKSLALELLNAARLAMKDAGMKVAVYYDSKKQIEEAAMNGISVETTQDSEFVLYGVFADEKFIWGQVFKKEAQGYLNPLQDTRTWDAAIYNELKAEF